MTLLPQPDKDEASERNVIASLTQEHWDNKLTGGEAMDSSSSLENHKQTKPNQTITIYSNRRKHHEL